MRKLFYSFLFVVMSFGSTRAQDLIDFSYDWLDTNFFQSIHATVFGDWFSSPVVMETTGMWPDGEPRLEPRNSIGIGLVSFVYEPRVNIYNHYDYISVSVSAPVTASFSAVVGEANGIGHLHVPLMLEGNFFGHATNYSYDEKGFSIGLGVRYTFAPLIPIEDFGKYARRHWISPLGRISYKWDSYDDWYMVNVSFGYGQAYKYRGYSNVNTGDPITRTTLSRFSLLVTLGRSFEI